MSHSLIFRICASLILGSIIADSALAQNFINIPTATDIYSLNYLIEDDTITFDIIAKTTGYVGFGFTNISGMVSSDIFVGGIKDDGTTYFGDYTGITTGAPRLDVEQNWNLIEATESDNSTHIKFSRLLATGDLADIIIEDRLMNLIWSMGPRDDLLYHGYTRSTLSYNLISQTNDGVDPNPPPTMPAESTTTGMSSETTTLAGPPESTISDSFTNIPTATDIYSLNYVIEGDTITFAVIAQTKGYVGFGFSNISGMVSSDIFVGGIKEDGTTYFGDYTGITTGPPRLDAEQNWNLVDAFETATATHITFSRRLETGDLQDIIIKDDLMNIIWSMGSTDELSYHGYTRSTLTYNLISQTNGGVDPNPPPTPLPTTTLSSLFRL